MGKFERELLRRTKEEVDDFEGWYARNRQRIEEAKRASCGARPLLVKEKPRESAAVTAVKRMHKTLFLLLSVCVLLFSALFGFLLAQGQSGGLTFSAENPSASGYYGSDWYYLRILTDEELVSIREEYPFLNKLDNLFGIISYDKENGKALYMYLTGEAELTDYFLCTVRIVLDDDYEFPSQIDYQNFTDMIENESGTVWYRTNNFFSGTPYHYNLILLYNGSAAVYIDLGCVYGNITDFLAVYLGFGE